MPLGFFNSGQTEAGADHQFDTHAEALQNTSDFEVDDIVVINTTTGTWPFNKQAGDYRWNGVTLVEYNADLKQRVVDTETAVDSLSQSAHTHANKSVLDTITQALIDSWNTASNWVTTNGANVLTSLANKLDKGGYSGNAQDLKDEIDAIDTSGGNGPVSVHSDVDLNQGVTPKNGWIPKWVNGELILCMKEHLFYKGAPVVNTSANNDINATPLRGTFNFQRLGHYKITIKVSHSIDSTGADMVLLPTVDGQDLPNIFNGEMLRQEGKDSGGNNNDGRGTDQKNSTNGVYHYQNNSIGNKEILLDHFSQFNNVEASLWDLFIEVEEIFDPILLN